MSVAFSVTNDAGNNLDNHSVLVFATSSYDQDNWMYAAWQSLQPGSGGSSHFVLNDDISGYATSLDGTYDTGKQKIPTGYVSLLTSSGGLQPALEPPVLGNTVPSPTVTNTQAGIKNDTKPGQPMNIVWVVNGKAAVQSGYYLTPSGNLSAFELGTTLYFSVDTVESGFPYKYSDVSKMTAYIVSPGTSTVSVVVGYANGEFTFSFS